MRLLCVPCGTLGDDINYNRKNDMIGIKIEKGNSAPAPSPVALVHNTRPMSAKAWEPNGQAGDWVGSHNPKTPKGPELVLWLMILMLPVKFALILFGR
jgi:hypothetical protein